MEIKNIEYTDEAKGYLTALKSPSTVAMLMGVFAKKLSAEPDPTAIWRYQFGKYRILFTVDRHLSVLVLKILDRHDTGRALEQMLEQKKQRLENSYQNKT